jgi:hypothetical protein
MAGGMQHGTMPARAIHAATQLMSKPDGDHIALQQISWQICVGIFPYIIEFAIFNCKYCIFRLRVPS